MKKFDQHLINLSKNIRNALTQLNKLSDNLTLFVIDTEGKVLGTITDGDIRRALLNDFTLETSISKIMQVNFAFIKKENPNLDQLKAFKQKRKILIPVLNEEGHLFKLINLNSQRSFLPIDALLMAGGKGTRLLPLTEKTPKPLLKIGNKPIIEYNIDRLSLFGIDQQFISIKHFGSQIENYFGDGKEKGINIKYVKETNPLGTIGALALIKNKLNYDYQLVMNSDLLTDIDFENFYLEFINSGADLAIATIPYEVQIPYAVLETSGKQITSFKEKPTYTYYSNAGIYLMKKEVISLIPENTHYNATDLMDELINQGRKIISFPILGYWLDIGKHKDFEKAQKDIKQIVF